MTKEYIKSLTEAEMEALKTVLEDCVGNTHNLYAYLDDDTLTINVCRNGRIVAWCVWSEGNESCRYVDTLERLTDAEIEEQLL